MTTLNESIENTIKEDEIIFKGKSIKTNYIVYGFYYQDFDNKHYIILKNYLDLDYQTSFIEVYPASVCQFIKAFDKYKLPLFENDLILTDEGGWIGKIVFQNGETFLVDLDPYNCGFAVPTRWDKWEKINAKSDLTFIRKKLNRLIDAAKSIDDKLEYAMALKRIDALKSCVKDYIEVEPINQ